MVEIEEVITHRGEELRYKLDARGHAGAAAKGQDIVCAAASILMQTLGEMVMGMQAHGALQYCAVDYEHGMCVEAQAAKDFKSELLTVFAFADTGLKLLADNYPANLQLTIVNLDDDKAESDDGEADDGELDLQMFADGDGAAASPAAAASAEAAAEQPTAPEIREPEMTPAQKRLAIRSGVLKTGAKAAAAKALEGVNYGKQTEEGSTAAQAAEAGSTGKADATAGGDDAGKGQADAASAKEENPDAEFLDLIKGKYKDQFAKAVNAVNQSQQVQQKAAGDPRMDALVDALGKRYGVDGKDINALTKAISGEEPVKDNKYFERVAMEKGISVENAKELDRLQTEASAANAARQQAEMKAAEQQMRAQVAQIKANWDKEAAEVKAKYPSFDYKEARTNPDFADLMKRGVSLENAYRAIYFDRLMADSQASTAKAVEKGVTERIAARAARPGENGTRPGGAAVTKTDVNSLTKADREEIERRVLHGAKISF
jgi:uncharacterized protein YsxB (DUF464 family)